MPNTYSGSPAYSLRSAGVCTSEGETRDQWQAQQQPEVPRAGEVVDGGAQSPQDGGVQRRHCCLAETQRICGVTTPYIGERTAGNASKAAANVTDAGSHL